MRRNSGDFNAASGGFGRVSLDTVRRAKTAKYMEKVLQGPNSFIPLRGKG